MMITRTNGIDPALGMHHVDFEGMHAAAKPV
jgi:hypothetical protein